jgi:4-diphosphocytidyl-2-C-methyl-D-erythritol kinase
MNTSLQKTSPAKLNLFLHVTGQLKNGYHEIQTIYELIDLSDELFFSKNKHNQLNLTIDGLPLSRTNNLIQRAHTLLEKETGELLGVDIKLRKRIPIGAGLGGGSSNAATTLLALNELFNLKLTEEKLKDLGLTLGADVPVFIEGKTAWAEGIGEKLTPITLPTQYYVILVPDCFISTASIYHALPSNHRTPKITYAKYAFDQTHNDLEPIVLEKFPAVKKAMQWLNQFSNARLTGSGSAIFARFTTKNRAEQVANQLQIPGRIFIAQTLKWTKN